MRKIRSSLVAAAAIVIATTLAGCTVNIPFIGEVNLPDPSALSNPGPSIEEYEATLAAERTPALATPTIHEEGVLTVGIDFGTVSAPFAYREADGTVRGIDAELAYVLGDALGLDVRFVDAASQAALADVVMDVGLSGEARGLQVIGSYAESAVGLFYQGSEPLVDAYLLEGKRVGVQLNSISHAALQKASVKIDLQTFSSLNDAFEALAAGELDYVSCPAYPGAYLATEYPGITCGGTFNVPTGVALAVPANNATLAGEISRLLEEARANGLLDLVRSRWVGAMAPLTAESQLAGINYVLPGVTLDGAIESVTPMGEPTAGANAAAAPAQTESSSSSSSSSGYSTDYSGYGNSYNAGGYNAGTSGYDNSYSGYDNSYDAGSTSYDQGTYDAGGTSSSGGEGSYDQGGSTTGDGTVYSDAGGTGADAG